MKRIKHWAIAALMVASLGFVGAVGTETASEPEPADAASNCAVNYLYGSTTRTIARDSGVAYCDVQARLRRYRSGYGYVNIYSSWKLYEARVSSWANSGITWGADRNCGRVRTRSQYTGNTLRTYPWKCKY